ncbi:WXG100 family type VII secretion target [Nocardiopsis suaedae]|uniref:WXG100 family type VII secretion target n=1 Tax=Nocardiopsis suaedae TaxID=3018444 RepID=A0ABT4TNH0_9ACTN|nr:WXG100 family type VII secretion target [Nocardiopsis suaedae]MDA2806229.1 WXG100 family type VII secretion target [Nocardiopsis suaedae]
MSNFEVYGNVSGLQDLSGAQQEHLTRFKAIMDDIRSQSETTVNKWEGSGNDRFKAKAEEFDTQFAAVNDAFAKVIQATDDAASNYGRLSNRLNNLF